MKKRPRKKTASSHLRSSGEIKSEPTRTTAPRVTQPIPAIFQTIWKRRFYYICSLGFSNGQVADMLMNNDAPAVPRRVTESHLEHRKRISDTRLSLPHWADRFEKSKLSRSEKRERRLIDFALQSLHAVREGERLWHICEYTLSVKQIVLMCANEAFFQFGEMDAEERKSGSHATQKRSREKWDRIMKIGDDYVAGETAKKRPAPMPKEICGHIDRVHRIAKEAAGGKWDDNGDTISVKTFERQLRARRMAHSLANG